MPNLYYNSCLLTKEEAIEVQEALFRMGFRWSLNLTQPSYLSEFVYLWTDDMSLGFSYDRDDNWQEIPINKIKEALQCK